MTSGFSHNKKRNVGLVYEFLVRHLATQVINRNKVVYDKVLEIVKKYYGSGMPLSEEREIFEVIKNVRGVTDSVARRILHEAINVYRHLDHKKIELSKNNLIKEINCSFGKSFFSEHRLPEYKLLATIQLYLDGNRNNRSISESVQAIQLEDSIVNFMTTSSQLSRKTEHEDRIDDLVCALATNKFRNRYRHTLSQRQQKLLEEYAKLSLHGDEKDLNLMLNDEKTRILLVMRKARAMNEFKDDKVMQNRLAEAEEKLKLFGKQNNAMRSEEFVQEIMLYQKLEEELTSNE